MHNIEEDQSEDHVSQRAKEKKQEKNSQANKRKATTRRHRTHHNIDKNCQFFMNYQQPMLDPYPFYNQQPMLNPYQVYYQALPMTQQQLSQMMEILYVNQTQLRKDLEQQIKIMNNIHYKRHQTNKKKLK